MNADIYSSEAPEKSMPTLRMFTWTLRLSWFILSILLLLAELLPRPNFAPLMYYSYSGAKVLMFVSLGFLTPLTFWRFDRLGLGVLFSVAAAGLAELSQSAFPGHRSSFPEFLLKLLLLVIGFTVALNVRYDRRLALGRRFGVRLTDSHFTSQRDQD
jgi:hypothetical protein